jgi:hypothetical protein
MVNNITVPKELSNPILKWIAEQSHNLESLFEIKPPLHKGYVIGTAHLNKGFVQGEDIKSMILYEAGFPYKTLKEINNYILKKFDLSENTPYNPEYGILISYSTKGHSVHTHTDTNFVPDHTHVRFNLLLTKTEGGDPIINGKTIEVKQDEVWICAAGMFPHSTTEITGEEPRIMISFGHSIENTLLNKII